MALCCGQEGRQCGAGLWWTGQSFFGTIRPRFLPAWPAPPARDAVAGRIASRHSRTSLPVDHRFDKLDGRYDPEWDHISGLFTSTIDAYFWFSPQG